MARGVGAACLLVLPAVLLGSCMLQSDPRVAALSGTSAEQSRDNVRSMLDGTQQLIGGTWLDQDDPTPRACVVQWGLSGNTYASLRIVAPPTTAPTVTPLDPRVTAWVQREWERQGYTVARTEIGPVSQLVGTSPLAGELLILRVSDRGMTLQGESACRPVE